MLFIQWNLEDALEVRYEEGFEDGVEKGETIAMIKLVIRMCQKGKESSVIAEELQVPWETVEKICEAIKTAETNDVQVIYDQLQKL